MALMVLLQGVAWPLVCLIVMSVQFLVACGLRRRIRRLQQYEDWYYQMYDQLSASLPSSNRLSVKPLPCRKVAW